MRTRGREVVWVRAATTNTVPKAEPSCLPTLHFLQMWYVSCMARPQKGVTARTRNGRRKCRQADVRVNMPCIVSVGLRRLIAAQPALSGRRHRVPMYIGLHPVSGGVLFMVEPRIEQRLDDHQTHGALYKRQW